MKNNLIKAAAAVPELKIGDITYNTEKIIEVIVEHSDSGLIVFPELSITGYTCADLFQSDLLLNEASLSSSLVISGSSTMVVGSLAPPIISVFSFFVHPVIPNTKIKDSSTICLILCIFSTLFQSPFHYL